MGLAPHLDRRLQPGDRESYLPPVVAAPSSLPLAPTHPEHPLELPTIAPPGNGYLKEMEAAFTFTLNGHYFTNSRDQILALLKQR